MTRELAGRVSRRAADGRAARPHSQGHAHMGAATEQVSTADPRARQLLAAQQPASGCRWARSRPARASSPQARSRPTWAHDPHSAAWQR